MALGKSRNSKRSSSSSSSYASTVTTVVFIAVCVFGVWMLTYNPVSPPQNSTRTATYSTDPDHRSITNSDVKKDPPAFEDNPGDLPDDAIKTDDDGNDDSKSHQDQKSESTPGDSKVKKQPLEGLEVKESAEEQEKQREARIKVEESNKPEEQKTSSKNIEDSQEISENQKPDEDRMHGMEQQQQDLYEGNENLQEPQEQIRDEDQERLQQQLREDQSRENTQEPQKKQDVEHNEENSENQQKEQEEFQEQSTEGSEPSKEAAENQDLKTKVDAQEAQQQKENSANQEDKEAKNTEGVKEVLVDSGGPVGERKERRKDESDGTGSIYGYTWQLCNVTAGADYIPCLDNEKALRKLRSTRHFEHRERHCPEEGPTCLVPLPEGYRRPILWPKSRDKIWYHNVPHAKLAEVKGHQNWVKVTGEFLTFPGGGTQFIHGALHYIDFLQKSVPDIAWGKHTRVILDVGCGVASLGGYLFERDVLTMSFAPKDEHEAQVQFALERGNTCNICCHGFSAASIPKQGGMLLLELNRVLRPGGYFVWSATPVYQKLQEDVEIWKEMSSLTASMCWELVTIQKDKINSIGAAIYRKPSSNDCYEQRKHKRPPMCKNDDDPNAAWYVPLQACMHRVPSNEAERGNRWPEAWPPRLQRPPYWFAAALKDIQVWVLNVVNIDSPDTLPIIYERGLFGIYHDWCESFSTYPRTYDLLHADHLFSKLKKRCKLAPVLAEVDRIVRPGGKLIVRDESITIGEVENLLKSMHWEVHLTFSKNQEGMLSAQKGDWRPDVYVDSS
ncbi:putative methyltransferase PMT27 [Morella rubra]|uniref:Putative methyltransferase PMT27 n=1 Tax=Morella rubra TaxID=262757 RepID=A0A6A1UVQ2_9ROSI|nr:putative methyltransferase PMT27 [Morella rubra]